MQNSIDHSITSFITSAAPANAGGSKADPSQIDATNEHFSGILNQAVQSHPQPEAHQSAASTSNRKNAAKTHENRTGNAEHRQPVKNKAEQDAEAKTANAPDVANAAQATDSQDEQATDPVDDKPNAADLQALLQSLQPLDLTILNSPHLLGQLQLSAPQPNATEGHEATAEAGEAIAPLGADATGNTAAPANPLNLPNTLAFALPGLQQVSIPGLANGKPDAPNAAQAPAKDSSSGPESNAAQATVSSPDSSTLSLPITASSEAPADNGDLTRQAAGSLEGLAQSIGLNGGANNGEANPIKPNASLPSNEMFRKTLDSLHHGMKEMDGDIESVTDSAARKDEKSLDETNGTNSPATGQTTLSPADATDLFSATVGNAAPTSNSENAGHNAGIPQFSSLASNPLDQVAEGTSYSVKNGQKELIIRLNPNNLGEVRVNLTSYGNQELSARLIASTTESHDLLKGQLDSLKHSLEAQGITVDRLSVVLAGSVDTGNNTSAQHQHSHSHQEQQPQQGAQNGAASQQQQYNQSNPNGLAFFNQMNGQSQSSANWTQRLNNSSGGTADTDTSIASSEPAAAQNTDSNGSGRISILA